MSTTAQLQVVECDNKFELFAQLADIGRYTDRKTFRITVTPGNLQGRMAPRRELLVYIDGIQAEDGSGENWIITGHIVNPNGKKVSWVRNVLGDYGSFHGFLDMRRRKGFLEKR